MVEDKGFYLKQLVQSVQAQRQGVEHTYQLLAEWIKPSQTGFYGKHANSENEIANYYSKVKDQTAKIEHEKTVDFLTSSAFPFKSSFANFTTGDIKQDEQKDTAEELYELRKDFQYKIRKKTNLFTMIRQVMDAFCLFGVACVTFEKDGDEVIYKNVPPRRLYFTVDDHDRVDAIYVESWIHKDQWLAKFNEPIVEPDHILQDYVQVWSAHLPVNGKYNLEKILGEPVNRRNGYICIDFQIAPTGLDEMQLKKLRDEGKAVEDHQLHDLVYVDGVKHYDYKPFFVARTGDMMDSQYPISKVIVAIPLIRRLQSANKYIYAGAAVNSNPAMLIPNTGMDKSSVIASKLKSGEIIGYNHEEMPADAVRPVHTGVKLQEILQERDDLRAMLKEVFLAYARQYNPEPTQPRAAATVNQSEIERQRLLGDLSAEIQREIVEPIVEIALKLLRIKHGDYEVNFISPLMQYIKNEDIAAVHQYMALLAPVLQADPNLAMALDGHTMLKDISTLFNRERYVLDREEYERKIQQQQSRQNLEAAGKAAPAMQEGADQGGGGDSGLGLALGQTLGETEGILGE